MMEPANPQGASGELPSSTLPKARIPGDEGQEERKCQTRTDEGQALELSSINQEHFIAQVQQISNLEERQRLAHELQDAVTQTLFSASLIADVLPRIMERDPQEGRARLDELRRLTHEALIDMRNLLSIWLVAAASDPK